MKKLGLISALWALFCCPIAFAAGTIPYSLSQQLDEFGNPLSGGKLYLIQAGTVATPQNCYQDSGLTLVLPNPITLDAAGRLPQIFCADGSIKIRLTKSNGVNVVTADGILVVGASSGGGGGSPVDPTTVIATGDVKTRYGTGVLTGFVRMNGRTIGSASSGATERANADTQALFEYLWGANPGLVVSGGRGATANADWVANKTIVIPDMRGRVAIGMDDMGNTAAGILTTATCPFTTLGAGCGSETQTIAQANLPALTWPSTLGISNTMATSSTLGISNTMGISDTRTWDLNGLYASNYNGVNSDFATPGTQASFKNGGGQVVVGSGSISLTGSVSITGGVGLTGGTSITGGVTSGGSGTAISKLPPVMLFTVYIKL